MEYFPYFKPQVLEMYKRNSFQPTLRDDHQQDKEEEEEEELEKPEKSAESEKEEEIFILSDDEEEDEEMPLRKKPRKTWMNLLLLLNFYYCSNKGLSSSGRSLISWIFAFWIIFLELFGKICKATTSVTIVAMESKAKPLAKFKIKGTMENFAPFPEIKNKNRIP